MGSDLPDKLGDLLLGPPKDIHDPNVFKKVSLIAFLAWVGLGSDGVSSSCYGPQEAFLALGQHQYLAVFLALLTALTVFIISASYSQTIDVFPSGGGGYLVATKLLGTYPGLVSGCALVVDYVLTVAISTASGADAIFSFLPPAWLGAKLIVCIVVVLLMVMMNLRGVKESVIALLPIFLSFVVIHVFMITYVLISRSAELPQVAHDAVTQVRGGVAMIGALPLAVIFLRSYSLGGGTYTGIEAVSNGLPILREPKTVTGKHTMIYMALSLAFIAGGILIGYLLLKVEPEPGKTLNAVLFNRLAGGWSVGGIPIGTAIITFTLLTEGALLFVAAQTGFIDGPRVLATMATGRWLPHHFANLSTRLVTQDGVLAMGTAAAVILFATRARVDVLVVLYSINVFLTFTLSQLGMSVHWRQVRRSERTWKRNLAVNGVGCLFTGVILFVTLAVKFGEGGWVTVLMTSGLVGLCLAVRHHYDRVGRAIDQLNVQILRGVHTGQTGPPAAFDRDGPTAILLVHGFCGLGIALLDSVRRAFDTTFRNAVFLSVGEVDSEVFRGREEIEALEKSTRGDLDAYSHFATALGYHAEVRLGVGTDVAAELTRLCLRTAAEFPHAVFFAGKLIFSQEGETFFARFLHNRTALEVQAQLQARGFSLVILPIRVMLQDIKAAPAPKVTSSSR
jgi:amino acid transporter